MKILFASHTPFGTPFTVGSHHLARQMAAMGHDVLHIAKPVTPFHAGRFTDPVARFRMRRAIEGVREIAPRLSEAVTGSLLPRNPADDGALLPGAMWLGLGQLLRRTGFTEVGLLLLDEPQFFDIGRFVSAESFIYRPTDIYPLMQRRPGIAELERKILTRADAVISTSEPVATHVSSLGHLSIPSAIIENGVDLDAFLSPANQPSAYSHIPEPRLVYVGALDERFDWSVIVHAAASEPDWSFVIGGPLKSPPVEARNLRNVFLLGPQPYDAVPGLFQHAQVGMLPLSDHPANEGRSPMKLYEYLAAGMPVVSRSTSEIRRRQLPGVALYSDVDEFIQRTRRLLEELPDAAELRQVASEAGWDRQAKRVMEFALEGR